MNKNKKTAARMASVVLAGTLTLSGGASAVLAATPSEKEEVVYAMLDASGDVNGVYVVNQFSGGTIVDYGNYTSVRNLTTEDAITQEGDEVTFHTDADKVYYQGDLDTKDIPWNISVRYYMDGKEYTPEEIAGMSGALELKLSISENTKCDESFWDGYALQAAITLDTNQCRNIVAENATVANAGSDKQLSYIILPGKGADLTVTADVTDFEMDAITINGVKLNMNMEMDDSEIQDQINEICDAVDKLNDGAISLADGTGSLVDGAGTLYDGTVKVKDGAGSVKDGMTSLNSGITTVQDALRTLNGKSSTLTDGSAQVLSALQTIQSSLAGVSVNADQLSALVNSSAQINAGISSLVAGLSDMNAGIDSYYANLEAAGITDVNAYAAQNEQAAAALGITDSQRAIYGAYVSGGDGAAVAKIGELAAAGDAEALALYQQYAQTGDASGIQSYIQTAGKLINVETLLKADAAYIAGSNTLIAGVDGALDEQNGALMTGAVALRDSYAQFDAAIGQMVSSLSSLAENMTTLKNGIDALTAQYQTLNTGILEYTGAVGQITSGYGQICQGAATLANGTADLYDGTTGLVSGVKELYDGSTDLDEGAGKLADATTEFSDKTADADTKVTNTITDTVDEMMGKDVEVVSFVSEKNTNVDSVLFVMKTDAVQIPDEEEIDTTVQEEKTFWQKILALFGVE